MPSNSPCVFKYNNFLKKILSHSFASLSYIVFICTVFVVGGQCHAKPESAASILIIESDGTAQKFVVELAVSRSQKSIGLMYRRSLPQKNGMLFVYKTRSKISMWMKNTYLALDMLFIDTKGRINYIHEGAVPLSEKLITGKFPARAVLELNAGIVSRFGFKVGDLVRHSIFGNE